MIFTGVFVLLVVLLVIFVFRSRGSRRKTAYVFGAVVFGLVLLGLFLLLSISDFFQIDACLDRGGKWDQGANECQLEERR